MPKNRRSGRDRVLVPHDRAGRVMSTLNAAARAAIAEALASALHGERTAEARRLAAAYGVSVSTVYRLAERRGAKRKRAPRRPEYREWTRVAVALAHSAPKPIPLDVARDAGIEKELLPPEAATMPISTAYRIAREELDLAMRSKRTHRLHADYPMQAVQFDGSSSEYLVVKAPVGDDDWLLKLHRRPYSASGYKNKPLGADRNRVLVYSFWDMCTGYTQAIYAVGRGEDALGSMQALCWACAEKDDPRIPFHGLPEDLWLDQGPGWKSAAARDLLERLDINPVPGEPYKKERMGGVERTHCTRWSRFERALFLRDSDTILLSELNARVVEFEIGENARRLSRTPVDGRSVSRTAAWVALTNRRPSKNPLRKLPENAIETMAREVRRKVDRNGIFRWAGVEYEVAASGVGAKLHWRFVIARQAADGTGNLVVEDLATGERAVALRYRPRKYGDIRSAPATGLEKLLNGAETVDSGVGADVYAPTPTGAVARRPARSAPAATLDNPLDAERYTDLDEAMRAFCALYPHALSPANRRLVIQHLEGRGLSRAAVVELAQELTGLAGQRA